MIICPDWTTELRHNAYKGSLLGLFYLAIMQVYVKKKNFDRVSTAVTAAYISTVDIAEHHKSKICSTSPHSLFVRFSQ